ncbi:MAG TPA: MFS transporter [Candidatus Binatia bacterium]|nr:MFS transporter [Candidatus Binatia bacterium]
MTARIQAAFPALAVPMYRRYISASMLASIGVFMQQTATGWLVLILTESPALLGLATAAYWLPSLLLAVFAGVVADRVDRRRLLVGCNVVAGLCALVLALATTLGVVEYWHVLLISLLLGLTFTVQQPANQAVVSTLVPREALGSAIALNAAQFNLLRIVAPGVAGLFIAADALELGFWVNGVALLIVATLIAGIAIPSTHLVDRAQAAVLSELRDGVRYVAGSRALLTIVLLPAVPALLVLNYNTFIPIYARDILATGPQGIGLLIGAVGAGALAGSLSLAALRPSGGSGRLIVGSMLIVGVSLATFAVSRFLPLSMVALLLIGAFQVQFYSTTNVLIQVLVPAGMHGRVLSLYLLTSIGLIPVASLAGGALAEVFGVEAVLAGGGILTVTIALGVAVLEREILRLKAAQVQGRAA